MSLVVVLVMSAINPSVNLEDSNKEESQGFRIAYFSPKESNQVEHSDPIVK